MSAGMNKRSQWAWNKHRDRRNLKAASEDGANSGAGYVYIFELGYDGLYKVGMSVDVKRRLQDLSASNPRAKCVMSSRVKNMRHTEKVMHGYLKKHHVEREIYRLDAEMLQSACEKLMRYTPQTTHFITCEEIAAQL